MLSVDCGENASGFGSNQSLLGEASVKSITRREQVGDGDLGKRPLLKIPPSFATPNNAADSSTQSRLHLIPWTFPLSPSRSSSACSLGLGSSKVVAHDFSIGSVQQQVNCLRDIDLSRVDAKMGSLEVHQLKFDRRLAELTGNYKGLSEEMQSHIRRLDLMDCRMWEWRQTLDEAVNQKLADIQQQQEQALTSMRTTHTTDEDLMKRFNKRLQSAEDAMEKKVASSDHTQQALLNLHTRLLDLESVSVDVVALSKKVEASAPDKDLQNIERATLFLELEKRLSGVGSRIDQILQDAHDNRSRLEAHEERLKTLRTLFDSREESNRKSVDRVERSDRVERIDLEIHVKEMSGQVQDLLTRDLKIGDKLETIEQTLKEHASGFDQTNANLRSFHERLSSYIVWQPESPRNSKSDLDIRIALPPLSEWMSKVDDLVSAISIEVEDIRAELGRR